MLLFDPLFWIVVGPAFLVAMWAQVRVKSTFARYSKVPARSGMSGASAARAILRGAGLGVEVEPVGGQLTDHYDPRKRKLRLSEGVYGSKSLAALGVAAHEAGHAIQHSAGYAPMAIRSFFVPVATIGSHGAMPLFFIGLVFGGAKGLPFGQLLMTIAIIIFAAAVVFYLITLPVEINASRRAMALLTSQGIIGEDEAPAARKVLTAAALTYLAAALMAVLQLVYMILRSRR
ncbi:MAG: zinc metallopeptidase [Planctomycetota bacterium]|jgi:Zn-dependent membrane protease YugP